MNGARAEGAQAPIETVMLIDDELVDRILCTRILERSGVCSTVLPFGDPRQALNFLARAPRQRVDLIFLDINMPGMSGFDFIEAATHRLGERFTCIDVVILSTSTHQDDIEHAARSPVVKHYVRKPLTVDRINRMVIR